MRTARVGIKILYNDEAGKTEFNSLINDKHRDIMVLADRFTDVVNLMQGQGWGQARNIVFFSIYTFPGWNEW